ncbi:molybdopterin-guanine dinucleotide biosynthesis protein B [Thioflexithrix psekupsensis]|uniref:Molybdopterin-guanine dinucleotide biosynthesis protein B n=1 Tax=Thioflexithrix psekupsensis TaxID=1570016 RepID=A0A251X7M5_9GAMM|nr:molybdopterin-guanine dinucleotide biosynthesis protein B [Thioflexithrix psekupsensis]OUD13199.1 molybdopterin-guanine dinucleotide biosynthesis protein B [Thioflexithrix psekupsensis]
MNLSPHLSTTIPVFGIAAYSGTGKTTLLLKLLPLLKQQGLRIAVIKHAHHQFEIDQPGKDSYRLRHEGGADQVLVASRQRWVLMAETGHDDEPRLNELLPHLKQQQLDFILVEGFKHESFPKLELYRPSLGHPLMFPSDESIIAIACDSALNRETTLPVLDLNNAPAIAAFILKWYFELHYCA